MTCLDGVCSCSGPGPRCGGSCTLTPLMLAIAASINAAQAAQHPVQRFDGKDWLPSDASRSAMAGQRMGKFAVLTEYRSDWSEQTGIVANKTWSARYPCPRCAAKDSEMYKNLGSCSLLALPWPERAAESYGADLQKHLRRAELATEGKR